jgi:glycyl-tRNA synthetase (class II)
VSGNYIRTFALYSVICHWCNLCIYNDREFVMAEIEHFVDPLKKSHPRFNEVKDTKLRLLDQSIQSEGKTEPKELTVGMAIEKVKHMLWLESFCI